MYVNEQDLFVMNVLQREDIDEIITKLIMHYCDSSVNNAKEIIALNTKIANSIITNGQKEITSKNEAIFWLITQKQMNLKDKKSYFASLVPVCKAYFPRGKLSRGNPAEEKYFNDFIEIFRDKKVFSWEKDKSWADDYGYSEYLRLIENNIKNLEEVKNA